MADITVASFEQISTILARLATNYSNLFIDYEKIFYDPEPQDVTVQIYNINGELETFTIPNRAKDRQFILNGEGSPDSVVFANKGAIYQDLLNGKLYLKQVDNGADGWYPLVSEADLKDIIVRGNSSPEGRETASLGTLFINRFNGALYIKTTSTGNTGWVLISANTSLLAKVDLSNLSEEGEAHFVNPSLSNLDEQGQEIIDSKEVLTNKVTFLSRESTDTEYPSAKIVFDEISKLSNKDLSNLSINGEEHFLRQQQLRDCILYAPNGGVSFSGRVLTLPRGTFAIGSKGLSVKGHPIQEIKETGSNLNETVTWTGEKTGVAFLRFQKGSAIDKLISCNITGYSRGEEAPVGEDIMVWYNPRTNKYFYTEDSGTTWTEYVMSEVAQFRTNQQGEIVKVIPYYSFLAASDYELEALKDLMQSNLDHVKNTLEDQLNDETSARTATDNSLSSRISDNVASIENLENNLIANYSSPSDIFEEYSWEQDKEYVAPKDGWFTVLVTYISGGCNIYNPVTLLGNSCSGKFDSTTRNYCSVRVRKGQRVKVDLIGDASVTNFRFVPAERTR